MKKTLYILLALVTLCMAGSCRRTSHNGDLDGFWRVTSIENIETGEVTDPGTERFIAITLELMQLRAPGFPVAQGDVITGVIDYNEKKGRLAVEFPNHPAQQNLDIFGIPSNPVVFSVKVTSRHLVLTTDKTRVTCHRF